MRFATIIKALAAFVVLAIMAATLVIVLRFRENLAVPELENQQMLLVLESTKLPDVEPGDRASQRAAELIATGDLEQAKEKLHFIINFSPGSPAAKEARRILGEVYLDEIFAPGENDWKKLHVVKKGEFPLNLAKKYETTLDCMMVVNNLNRLQIHPGDKLYMVALNFNIRIDLKRMALTLRRTISEEPRREEFVKEYTIERFRLPSQKKALVRTEVKDKKGFVGLRPVSTGSDAYVLRVLDYKPQRLELNGKLIEVLLRLNVTFRIEDAQGRPLTEPRTVVATRSYQYNVETVNTDDQEKNYLNQVIVDDVAQQIVRQISSNRIPPAQQ